VKIICALSANELRPYFNIRPDEAKIQRGDKLNIYLNPSFECRKFPYNMAQYVNYRYLNDDNEEDPRIKSIHIKSTGPGFEDILVLSLTSVRNYSPLVFVAVYGDNDNAVPAIKESFIIQGPLGFCLSSTLDLVQSMEKEIVPLEEEVERLKDASKTCSKLPENGRSIGSLKAEITEMRKRMSVLRSLEATSRKTAIEVVKRENEAYINRNILRDRLFPELVG
jgi:hypothetical protein